MIDWNTITTLLFDLDNTLIMFDEHDYLREMFDCHEFDDSIGELYQEFLTEMNK